MGGRGAARPPALDMVDIWVAVVDELRPDLDLAAARTVVQGVFPVVNQVAYALDHPRHGVPLVPPG